MRGDFKAAFMPLLLMGVVLFAVVNLLSYLPPISLPAAATNVFQWQLTEMVFEYFGLAMVVLILLLAFVVSPFSNILNLVTIPLGYEWQSCPNCVAVGVSKLTYSDCASCGEQVCDNFTPGVSPAGEGDMHHFCDRDCVAEWEDNR